MNIYLLNWFKYIDKTTIKLKEFFNFIINDTRYQLIDNLSVKDIKQFIDTHKDTDDIIILHSVYSVDTHALNMSEKHNIREYITKEKLLIGEYINSLECKLKLYTATWDIKHSIPLFLIASNNFKIISSQIDTEDVNMFLYKKGLEKSITHIIPFNSFYSYHFLSVNNYPKKKIALLGLINNDYYLRMKIKNKNNPNIQPIIYDVKYKFDNRNMHYIYFLKKINNYIACFVSGVSGFNKSTIVHKVYEVLSTGSLLVCDVSEEQMLAKIGLHHNKHCFIVDINKDKWITFILSPSNKKIINEIRYNGYNYAKTHFTAYLKYLEFKNIFI